MTIKKKIKITRWVLALMGTSILLTFFLLGTFFDEQVSRWFYPQGQDNFFGIFFQIFGMGIYTIPIFAMVIVFLNWLIFTQKKKISRNFVIPFYSFVILILLVLDSVEIFHGGNRLFWMSWTIGVIFYLLIYLTLLFFFYHPHQIKKFKHHDYHLQSLLAMAIFIFLAYFSIFFLKMIFVRPRFLTVMNGNATYHPWWKIDWNPYQMKNNSFPSGHTAIAMSLLSLLFLIKKNHCWNLGMGAILWLAIGLIGFARIVYLKHFLTDVTAAMMIGGGWFYLGNWINQQKWMERYEVKNG